MRVAAVHASPVYMNTVETMKKVLALIDSAGKDNVDLLVFPETFLPGYPFWAMIYSPLVCSTKALPTYINSSISMYGPEVEEIKSACKEANVAVVLGVSERAPDASTTIFNSQFYFDRDGQFVGVHRKLQPTFQERTIWAQGSGYTLRTFDMKDKYKLGGLICWEHSMNLARHALVQQGVQLHAASWPSYSSIEGFRDGSADKHIEAMMVNHAFTAQCFVLAASCPVDETALEYMERHIGPQSVVEKGGGWSGIIHPKGLILQGPVRSGGDQMLVCSIDLQDIVGLKVWVDSAGHYSRPEILRLSVDDRPVWTYDEESISSSQSKRTVREI